MKKQIESILLTNSKGIILRIYKSENTSPPVFFIGPGDSDHFPFTASEAKDILQAIRDVTESFS